MNRWRRYVYLVVDNLDGTYPLRRIDASTLFLSRNQARLAYPPPGPQETPLPRPHLSFTTPSRTKGTLEFLGLFGVWLGFSSQGNLLCCSSPDLGASVRRKPELDVIWHDWTPLGEWIPLKRHLVHLGSGNRFCVAKMFERVDLTRHGNKPHVERFAVFTGLELQRPAGGDGREPTMIEHRSLM